jgi:hypothetical protein
VRERHRDVRPHEDALGAILALEVPGEVVELGQRRALRVRQQELQRCERLLEARLDPVPKLLQPPTRQRGDRNRSRIADHQLVRIGGTQQIDLVVDAEARDRVRPDLL